MNKSVILGIVFIIILIILHFNYRNQLGIQHKLNRYINQKDSYKSYVKNGQQKVRNLPYMDIDTILQKYNTLLKPTTLEFTNKKYIYYQGNLDPQLKETSEKIIKQILNIINEYSGNKYKYMNIESIIEKRNVNNTKLVTTMFFMHELDTYSTRKLVLEYVLNNDNTISLNFIKPTTSSDMMQCNGLSKLFNPKENKETIKNSYHLNWNNSLHPYYYFNNETLPPWIQVSGQLKDDIKNLYKVCYSQEPCKYDLDKWDKNGVNVQSKLHKTCNVINHSDRILNPEPYVNPTLFKIDT